MRERFEIVKNITDKWNLDAYEKEINKLHDEKVIKKEGGETKKGIIHPCMNCPVPWFLRIIVCKICPFRWLGIE